MSADTEHRHDDGPVTASKTADKARELFAESVTIARPAEELYAAWRDPAALVRFLDNVVAVEPAGDDRWHWTVRGPLGRELHWHQHITHDVPGRELSWQSEPGGDLDHKGKISFVDAGARGTIVRATMAYDSPGGLVGKVVAKLAQREPRIQTRRDLHRFKQLMEAGEVATSARNRRIHEERYGPDGQHTGEGA